MLKMMGRILHCGLLSHECTDVDVDTCGASEIDVSFTKNGKSYSFSFV